MLEVKHLEEHKAVLKQPDTITITERQNFVIVHHRVHVLNPDGVDITVVNDPALFRLLVITEGLVGFLENLRQEPISPVSRLRVQDTIKLVKRDRLGINDIFSCLFAILLLKRIC